MEYLIEEFTYNIIDIFLFIFGVTCLVTMLAGGSKEREFVEQKIGQKYNVYEMTGEYSEKIIKKSSAEVISEIKSFDEEIQITIRNYNVTDEDIRELRDYNDAANILEHIDINWTYQVLYSINGQGQITDVKYEPVF